MGFVVGVERERLGTHRAGDAAAVADALCMLVALVDVTALVGAAETARLLWIALLTALPGGGWERRGGGGGGGGPFVAAVARGVELRDAKELCALLWAWHRGQAWEDGLGRVGPNLF